MMDSVIQSYDIEVEEGELSNSSVEVYTPLQRPATGTSAVTSAAGASAAGATAGPLATCHQMQRALEEEDESLVLSSGESSSDSSSGESSEGTVERKTSGTGTGGRKKRKRILRAVMLRVEKAEEMNAANAAAQEKRARFKKYNIWTAALQEEALTENMRGCDVTRSGCSDRNVENYDFKLLQRLNGENCLKRRHSNSTDDLSDSEQLHAVTKRGRPATRSDELTGSQRRSVKSRLGYRARGRGGHSSSPASGSDNSAEPRFILDLEADEGREPLDVAREIANKLYEEKDELLVRAVEVLGTALPIELYKETQRIEAEGGMMIKNGSRRRTPGGVFLFLLKNHNELTSAQHKLIFHEERQTTNKWRKELKSLSRERKVKELKKRLSEQERELPALSTRKDHFMLGSDLSLECQPANLSNPPPSPVGQEHSPEYKTHAINHVLSDAPSPEKPTTSAAAAAAAATASKELISYDNDFLDINCGEMDLF